MKKIIISVLFFGCAVLTPKDYVYEWEHDIEVDSIKTAMNWCSNNVEYKDDTMEVCGRKDYWQTPKETHERRTGDCEDYCILFMQLIYEMNNNPKLIYYKTTDKEYPCHAIVKNEDKYYTIQGNRMFNKLEDCPKFKEKLKEYTYSETLYMAENFHKDTLL